MYPPLLHAARRMRQAAAIIHQKRAELVAQKLIRQYLPEPPWEAFWGFWKWLLAYLTRQERFSSKLHLHLPCSAQSFSCRWAAATEEARSFEPVLLLMSYCRACHVIPK